MAPRAAFASARLPILASLAVVLVSSGCVSPPRRSSASLHVDSLRRSVVKIYVTIQRPNYALPWQSLPPANASGSGFIIGKRRILTNAHIVSDACSLQVQKDGNPRRFDARARFVGHDCDLATVEVDDPSFFDDTTPLDFADEIPRLNDEVAVMGYPMGGTYLSMTRGVVSRIDYATYSHSAMDQHLVLQVDAAINPGNSGGPVLYQSRVVGLAFQVLAWAENIGYAVPVPVIRHFLDDIEDGAYNGYPELGISFLHGRNPAMRNDLRLPPDLDGAVVSYVDPFGSARGLLAPRDVLLAIDGHPIANDGTVLLGRNRVLFFELLERKQWGNAVRFRVWRNGSETEIPIPLTNPLDPFAYRNEYDRLPEYFVLAGLVFCPLNREYLASMGRAVSGRNQQQLLYYSQYAKIDGLYRDRDEFVVLVRRLPHSVNTYAEQFENGIVSEVNGVPIRGLRDLKKAFETPQNGFHVVTFAGMDETLVLEAASASRAAREILERYGVPQIESFRENP